MKASHLLSVVALIELVACEPIPGMSRFTRGKEMTGQADLTQCVALPVRRRKMTARRARVPSPSRRLR